MEALSLSAGLPSRLQDPDFHCVHINPPPFREQNASALTAVLAISRRHASLDFVA